MPVGVLIERLLALTGERHVATYAGNIAYRSLFAIFPSLISFFWVLGIFHATALANGLESLATIALPDAVNGVIRHQLSVVPSGHAAARLTLGAALSFIVALWAASACFRATMEALNSLYDAQETRPAWRRYLLSILLALVTTMLLVGALSLVVFGAAVAQKVAEATGQGIMFRNVWLGVTWLVLLALVLSAFELVYAAAPNVQDPFRWISRGSLVALGLWVLFTLGFTFYINHVMNYTETYGALAGIAVLMIYVFAVSFILLLGAAINRTLESDESNERAAYEIPQREQSSRRSIVAI